MYPSYINVNDKIVLYKLCQKMCLTEFLKTTKKGPWKVAKNNGNVFPYLKCSSMKPWEKGSRTSNIEDLWYF